MRVGKGVIVLGVLALVLFIWRPWHGDDADSATGQYAVVVAGDVRSLLSDQTAAPVVWSPTAGELMVPAALQPHHGERVLWFGAGDEGDFGWRWLLPGDQPFGDDVVLKNVDATGTLHLQTPRGAVALAAGETGTIPLRMRMQDVYFVGTFAELMVFP